MSTCLRTRRVTHLTSDDARVELRYQIWNFQSLFGVSDGIRDITMRENGSKSVLDGLEMVPRGPG